MLRNSARRPEIGLLGRIWVELQSENRKHRLFGWPSAGRRAEFEVFPNRVRPTCGPEARFPARKHYCVISGMRLLCPDLRQSEGIALLESSFFLAALRRGSIAQSILLGFHFFALVCLRSRGPPGGPGGFREGPRMAQGGFPGAFGPPGTRVKKHKNPYLSAGPH